MTDVLSTQKQAQADPAQKQALEVPAVPLVPAVDPIQFPVICAETGQLDFNKIVEYIKTRDDYSQETTNRFNETVYQQLWPAIKYSQSCKRSLDLSKTIWDRAYTFISKLYADYGNYWVASFCLTDYLVGSPIVSLFDSRVFNYQCPFCLGASLEKIDQTRYESNWLVGTYVQFRRALIDPRDQSQKRLVAIPKLTNSYYSEIKFDIDDWRENKEKQRYPRHPYQRLGWTDEDSTGTFPLYRYHSMHSSYYKNDPNGSNEKKRNDKNGDWNHSGYVWNCCRRCFIETIEPIFLNFNDQMWWRTQLFASEFLNSFHCLPSCVWNIVLQYLRHCC